MMIEYGFSETPFGDIMVTKTPKGISDVHFITVGSDDAETDFLHRHASDATFIRNDSVAEKVRNFFFNRSECEFRLDTNGSELQQKVWNELMKVPFGTTISYQQLAQRTGMSRAVRAVATAVGKNPIALIIPCHRIIHKDGTFGQYRWGAEVKRKLIQWEASYAAKK